MCSFCLGIIYVLEILGHFSSENCAQILDIVQKVLWIFINFYCLIFCPKNYPNIPNPDFWDFW